MDRPEPKYLRAPEVCGLLGISRTTLYRWIAAGEIPQPRDMGGGVRWWHKDDMGGGVRWWHKDDMGGGVRWWHKDDMEGWLAERQN